MSHQKLGRRQRVVLASVRDHGSPHGSMGQPDYVEWTWRQGVAHKLIRRGWIDLLPHTHPGVATGRMAQYRLTDEGERRLSEEGP